MSEREGKPVFKNPAEINEPEELKRCFYDQNLAGLLNNPDSGVKGSDFIVRGYYLSALQSGMDLDYSKFTSDFEKWLKKQPFSGNIVKTFLDWQDPLRDPNLRKKVMAVGQTFTPVDREVLLTLVGRSADYYRGLNHGLKNMDIKLTDAVWSLDLARSTRCEFEVEQGKKVVAYFDERKPKTSFMDGVSIDQVYRALARWLGLDIKGYLENLIKKLQAIAGKCLGKAYGNESEKARSIIQLILTCQSLGDEEDFRFTVLRPVWNSLNEAVLSDRTDESKDKSSTLLDKARRQLISFAKTYPLNFETCWKDLGLDTEKYKEMVVGQQERSAQAALGQEEIERLKKEAKESGPRRRILTWIEGITGSRESVSILDWCLVGDLNIKRPKEKKQSSARIAILDVYLDNEDPLRSQVLVIQESNGNSVTSPRIRSIDQLILAKYRANTSATPNDSLINQARELATKLKNRQEQQVELTDDEQKILYAKIKSKHASRLGEYIDFNIEPIFVEVVGERKSIVKVTFPNRIMHFPAEI